MAFLRWLLSLLGFRRPSGGAHEPSPRRQYPLITIRRHKPEGKAPPLHWTPCHPSTQKRFKADLTCSHGHGLSLKGHEIYADGRVRPSVVCRAPGCTFHEFVRLEGWTAGHLQ
jgi:hypothetical protein